MSSNQVKTRMLRLGLSDEQEIFLREAARLKDASLRDFVLMAARQAAEQLIIDQRRFVVNEKQWAAFSDSLHRPARYLPYLGDLISHRSNGKSAAIQPKHLRRLHDSSKFDCENDQLNSWIKKEALESDANGSTFTHVLAQKGRVIGYYSFTVGAVERDRSQAKDGKSVPRGTIPILLLNRIAIDRRYHGQGLSTKLTAHALWRAYNLSRESVPLRCLMVVAPNNEARSFYSSFDFEPWSVDPWRMCLLIKDLKHTLGR